MEPSQISKRTHSELEEDIEELRMRDLRLRYKKLHPADSESDESFKTFFEDAEGMQAQPTHALFYSS
jgi:hypothetical protein